MIIEISPESATIISGQSQEYRVIRYTPSGRAKDVTKGSSFAIEAGAGGSWNKNVYSSENVGSWQVTATYRRRCVVGMLNVVAEPSKAMLYGRVTDAKTSLPIAEIDVNCDGYTGKTDSNGSYEITNILAGTYSVVFSDTLGRYKEVINMGIILDPGESERLDVELYPLGVPQPLAGALRNQWGRVGEYSNTIAFVYGAARAVTHLNVERGGRHDYILPEVTLLAPIKVVLTSETDAWMVFGVPLSIAHYQLTDTATLVSLDNQGDSASRLGGFLRLSSGKLLLVWHQQVRGLTGITVGFGYMDSHGDWHTFQQWIEDYQFASGNPASRLALAQNPDGSIWCFVTRDGHKILVAIKLIEVGDEIGIVQIWNPLIDGREPLAVEGELPWLATIAGDGGILVAYQNNTYHLFSVDPFVKGANINVIKVRADGSYSLLYEVPEWTERANPILLGKDWVAYGRINEADLNWNDLAIWRNGESEFLGDLKKGVPRNQGIEICNSTDYIIALMADNMTHFYPT